MTKPCVLSRVLSKPGDFVSLEGGRIRVVLMPNTSGRRATVRLELDESVMVDKPAPAVPGLLPVV